MSSLLFSDSEAAASESLKNIEEILVGGSGLGGNDY